MLDVKIRELLGANAESIFEHTVSLDLNTYIDWIFKTVNKRLETKKSTYIDWESKVIKIRNVELNQEQLKVLQGIIDNKDEVIEHLGHIVNLFSKRNI